MRSSRFAHLSPAQNQLAMSRASSPAGRQFGQRGFAILICGISLTAIANACLWDWDTLQMERRRFPGVLEMITGKFVRHSNESLESTIEAAKEQLSREPRDERSGAYHEEQRRALLIVGAIAAGFTALIYGGRSIIRRRRAGRTLSSNT